MSAPFRVTHRGFKALTESNKIELDIKGYLERLMKMIPGEVVGLYLIGSGFIPGNQNLALLIWTIICLVGVFIIRAYGTADPEKKLKSQWTVVLISSGAFIIWIYSLGGIFESFGIYLPWIGSLLVLAWTFFIPIFYKGTVE